MPREGRLPVPGEPYEKTFKCPLCKGEITVRFDGTAYRFERPGAEPTVVEGDFIYVTLKCPGCDRWIEFERGELVGP